MTDEEARALKPGDRVEARLSGKWVHAVVETVYRQSSFFVDGRIAYRPTVDVRRPGRDPRKRRFGNQRKEAGDLRPVLLDPPDANVYADWLDEAGEHRAAEKLRRAFPLDPGVRETG